jgi:hypothetical protein
MKNESCFQAPIHPLDSEVKTFGCRHATPDFCGKNGMPKICAFVRADRICLSPPQGWPKQFQKLKQTEFMRHQPS